jgi:hypothetical protein
MNRLGVGLWWLYGGQACRCMLGAMACIAPARPATLLNGQRQFIFFCSGYGWYFIGTGGRTRRTTQQVCLKSYSDPPLNAAACVENSEPHRGTSLVPVCAVLKILSYEYSEQARAPRTHQPRYLPRCGSWGSELTRKAAKLHGDTTELALSPCVMPLGSDVTRARVLNHAVFRAE